MIKAVFCALGILALSALISGGVLAHNEERGSFDRTLSVSEPVQLQVHTGSGSIRVHSGTGNQVIVHGEIRAHSDDATDKIRELEQNPPIEQSGNVIRIGKTGREHLLQNVSISYDITLPANSQAEANTGSGSIKIDAVKGPVNAHTGSGSIELSDAGIDVQAGTGSGSIHLANVSGRVNAHTGSGSIRADGDPTANWAMHTGSGSVTLNFPARAGFDLRAHTGSGRVKVEQPVTIQGEISKRRLEGKVHGGGPLVEVRTGSGSISIGTGGGRAL